MRVRSGVYYPALLGLADRRAIAHPRRANCSAGARRPAHAPRETPPRSHLENKPGPATTCAHSPS